MLNYKNKSSLKCYQDRVINKKIGKSLIDVSQDLSIVIENKEVAREMNNERKMMNNDLYIKIKSSLIGDKNSISSIRSRNHNATFS